MFPLSVKYNHITCHQQEFQSITYFLYRSQSSVEMAVECNNVLQCTLKTYSSVHTHRWMKCNPLVPQRSRSQWTNVGMRHCLVIYVPNIMQVGLLICKLCSWEKC